MKYPTYCPEHKNEELRIEYYNDKIGRGVRTGYCNLCAKHYPMCFAINYMDPCKFLEGHSGPHINSHSNSEFENDR